MNMKSPSEPLLTGGMAIVLAVLIIVSGIFAALALNAPGDDEKDDEGSWEPIPHDPYIQPLFSGILAYRFAEEQLAFGHRVPGTEDHSRARDFIRDTMEEFGYAVEYQTFSYDNTPGTNIIARSSFAEDYYPTTDSGSDSSDRKTLVVGAHYDTRPWTGVNNLTDDPIMGANDGASGVAVLLELARVLSVHPVNLDLEFVFFDLEDSGLHSHEYAQGSKVYAESLSSQEKDSILGAIVVDMIGDRDLDIFLEKQSDEELRDAIWKEAEKLDYDEFHHSEKYTMFDDHVRLINQGIPSVLLIDFDYPYWHTQEDTMDKISGDSLEKVGRVLERYIYSTSDYNRKLADEMPLVIGPGEVLTLSEGVHHINGDVTIRGTLILDDTTLIINAEEGSEHTVDLQDGGRLEIMNSILTAPQPSLIFQSHGSLVISDSTIENLWGNNEIYPYEGGIQLYGPDFRIEDSTVQYSGTRGIFIKDIELDGEPVITGTVFHENGEVGLFLEDSTVSISDCLFKGNGRGAIDVDGGGITVKDSDIGYSIPEGTCSSGSCGGLDPSFGIRISFSDEPSIISNNIFHKGDKGFIGFFTDDAGGQITLDGNTFQDRSTAVELTYSSVTVINSSFNATFYGVYSVSSAPEVRDNTFLNSHYGVYSMYSMSEVRENEFQHSMVGIFSMKSSGNISGNRISNSTATGIYLSDSREIVTSNDIINASIGITMTQDEGTELRDNVIFGIDYGIFIGTQSNTGNTSITQNVIYGSEWGIGVVGNDTNSIKEDNQYELDNVTNSIGTLKHMSIINFIFTNHTDDINITITQDNETIHSEDVIMQSGRRAVGLYDMSIDNNGTIWTNPLFELKAVSGDQMVQRSINTAVDSEVIIEFPIDQ